MYEIDPKPNSDQTFCDNCEMIVDEKMIGITADFKYGCTECIDRCGWCGHYYFRADMYNNPHLGYCCDACLHCEDYIKASKDEVLKGSLRCLFDTSPKHYEELIIRVAIQMGYFSLANDLKNDKS